jgi:transketolase
MNVAATDLNWRTLANALRVLSMDAVRQVRSGHVSGARP